MTYLILVILGITLLIVLWLSVRLTGLWAKVAVIPEGNDVLALLRRLDDDLARVDRSVAGLAPRIDDIEAILRRKTGIKITITRLHSPVFHKSFTTLNIGLNTSPHLKTRVSLVCACMSAYS